MSEQINYRGWEAVRLANREIELVVTHSVGPRIIRLAFKGEENLLAEYEEQMGGSGESECRIRGGHRLWVAPEAKPWSYEPDNLPCESVELITNGVAVRQAPGELTSIAKGLEIRLDPDRNRVEVRHIFTNRGTQPVRCATWGITMLAPGALGIIPLPPRVAHSEEVAPTQNWSCWGYTALNDPRLTFGDNYLLVQQTDNPAPNKIGLRQRAGWGGALVGDKLFVKYFEHHEGVPYPDGDVWLWDPVAALNGRAEVRVDSVDHWVQRLQLLGQST